MQPSEGLGTAVIRPCASTYVVLDGMPGLLLAGYIALWLSGRDVFAVVLIIAGVLAFVHLWIRSHSVVLSDSGLRYNTLLGSRTVAFSEVKGFRFEVGEGSYRDRFRARGFYRLVIRPRDPESGPIEINAKLFGAGDIHRIMLLLEEKTGAGQKRRRR